MGGSMGTPTGPDRSRQQAMYRRAARTLPGGTDSNFRAWGEDTIYIDRGRGALVWDIDGNEFVDLRMGYGPAILGHADPRIDDHVAQRMRHGVSFSLTSEDEVTAAELICELTFCDMARLTVSGTEATMHAMRVARGFTGRDKIVKFEGQYHGVHDYALISVLPRDIDDLGDRDNPVRLAWGRGIPRAVAETVIPVPYNDLEGLRRVFEREGEDIAAVIVEPVLGNAQGILPREGFLAGVRAICSEFGALLIFDEVKTGFRVARGGAAELFGITPDLATYAKALGNGYPVAAFGGRRDVMGMLPGHVSHGGTYAGNRVAAAAATKVLTVLRDTDALESVHHNGLRLQAGLHQIIARRGLAHVFTGVPAMFGVMFAERLPDDYRGWASTDHALYDAVARGMLLRGALPEPDSREPWFMAEAHREGDLIDRVLSAFEGSLAAALETRTSERVAVDRADASVPLTALRVRARRSPEALRSRHESTAPGRRHLAVLAHRRAGPSVGRVVRDLPPLATCRARAGGTNLEGARGRPRHRAGASRGDGQAHRHHRRAGHQGRPCQHPVGFGFLLIFVVYDVWPAVAALGLIGAALTIAGQSVILDYIMGVLILDGGPVLQGRLDPGGRCGGRGPGGGSAPHSAAGRGRLGALGLQRPDSQRLEHDPHLRGHAHRRGGRVRRRGRGGYRGHRPGGRGDDGGAGVDRIAARDPGLFPGLGAHQPRGDTQGPRPGPARCPLDGGR